MSRRTYSRMHASFWTSPTIRALTDDGRTLAAYLLTGPHSTMLGCFRVPDAYVAEDIGWGIERVSEGFRNLSEHGFAERDPESKWVFVLRYIHWNPIENPNHAKAMCRLWEQVPVARFRVQLARILLGERRLEDDQREALVMGSEGVSIPLLMGTGTPSHSGSGSGSGSGTRTGSGAGGLGAVAPPTLLLDVGQKIPKAKKKPVPKGERPDLDPSTLTPEEHAAFEALRDDPTLGPITLRPAEGARDLAKRFPSLDLAAAIIEAGGSMRSKNMTSYVAGVATLMNWLKHSKCFKRPGARPSQSAEPGPREPTPEENLAREREYSRRILEAPEGEGIKW